MERRVRWRYRRRAMRKQGLGGKAKAAALPGEGERALPPSARVRVRAATAPGRDPIRQPTAARHPHVVRVVQATMARLRFPEWWFVEASSRWVVLDPKLA